MAYQTARATVKELSLRVVARLDRGPVRFNALERGVKAPSPFALASALKKLQRDGLIDRVVHKVDPPAHVEYSLTRLGQGLAKSATALIAWFDENLGCIDAARQRFLAARQEEIISARGETQPEAAAAMGGDDQ